MKELGSRYRGLIPASSRSREELSEMGKKGAKVRSENFRNRKRMKEDLELMLSISSKSKNKDYCLKQNPTIQQEIIISMIEKAKSGDVNAFNAIRNTIGENIEKEDGKITIDVIVRNKEIKELINNI